MALLSVNTKNSFNHPFEIGMLELLRLLPPPTNVQQFAARFEVCWIWAKNHLSTYFLGSNVTDSSLAIIETALGVTREYGVIFKASFDKIYPGKINLDWEASLRDKGLEEYINSAKGRDEISNYFSLAFFPVPEFRYKDGVTLYRNRDGNLEVITIKKSFRERSRSMYTVATKDHLLTKEEWELDSYTTDKDKIVKEIERELLEEENALKEKRKILDNEKKK